jgi:hypothetical protein
VGKTILGLRIDDVIRAVNWLGARPNVDRNKISAYGNKASSMAVLHAAVLDTRIQRVAIENTLGSYRMIVDQPVHRNVSEVVVPGVLLHYDVIDLIRAVPPRQITIIHPQNAMGDSISDWDFQSMWRNTKPFRFAKSLEDVY